MPKMYSGIVKATLIGCCLTAISNVTAQMIQAHRTNSPFTINWTPIFQFVLYVLISCPPNYIWQQFIESVFPSQILRPIPSPLPKTSHDDQPKERPLAYRFSLRNLLTKLLIDQTLCAGINTLAFSFVMALFKGASYDAAVMAAKRDFWSILTASWKLWPLVSGFNYAVVKTVSMRTLIGNLAGVGWGVYLSFVAAR